MDQPDNLQQYLARRDFEESRWYPTYWGLKWGGAGALSLGALVLLLAAGFAIADGWNWNTFLAKLDPILGWMILGFFVINFVAFVVPWQIARLLLPYQKGWGLFAFRCLQVLFFGAVATFFISTRWADCKYDPYCWFFG